MKKNWMLTLVVAGIIAANGLVAAADSTPSAPDAYVDFNQKVTPLRQELYAKQMELDALYNSGTRDDAKVQQLFREIGEIKGKLFVAQSELRSQAGDSGMPYCGMGRGMGMHHGGMGGPGMGPRGDMGMGYGGGHGGHRGGYGGGHRGGWGW